MTNSVQAKVKYPCKEVTTKFGKRINVVFETADGELLTKWGKVEDDTLQSLKRNQSVTITKGENNKIIIFPINSVKEVAKQVIKQEKVNESVKDLLLKKAKVLTEHYVACDKLVKEQVKSFKNEDSLRAITTTVFLQSVRSCVGVK